MKHESVLIAGCLIFSVALNATAAIRYVAADSATPSPPYTNWSTAATTIQDAIDVSVAGDSILVTNGVYQTGGRVVAGAMTNRVAITTALHVRSVNGPEVTIIRGYQLPGGLNGNAAVRCVYLTNGATLVGFTLSHGATRDTGDAVVEQSGGGVWCTSSAAVVSNCVFAGNSAASAGGGAYSGTLHNCSFTENSAAVGGGAHSVALNGCTLAANLAQTGGGAYAGTLNNCVLTNNSAYYGGGAHSAMLTNCTLVNNLASSFGGGAHSGMLNYCTLLGNSAYYGGGAYSNMLNNCTLLGNSAASYGGGAYRCKLSKCTLKTNEASSGGGAFEATLNNCTLAGNSGLSGGGAHSSTLANCEVTANSASSGGGVHSGTLANCTLTGNAASAAGGGAYSATLNNCIAYYNRAALDPNYSAGTLNYCCTTPLPGSGMGNLQAEPQLASSSHLSAASPCRRIGIAAYTSGVDIDGETWANPPSMGCDENLAGTATGGLSVSLQPAYTNVAIRFNLDLTAAIAGRVTASKWEFGDGLVMSNRPYASHAWDTAGDYPVVLRAFNDSNPGGISATVLVHVVAQPVHYVAVNSSASLSPYSSWATAATNIQDAVDSATVAGALVLVSNGVYGAGGRVVAGAMSNRVAVTKPLAIHSINGPGLTFIQGNQVPGTNNGDSAVRCAYLGEGSSLVGFTLTKGATRAAGDVVLERSGGGVWCASADTVVSNCVLAGNSAASFGGGAYFGILKSCTLATNSAHTGGGGYHSLLNHCILTGNSAASGGGANSSTLDNCTLIGNVASDYGGGTYSGTLNGCSLMGNSAFVGGGTYSSMLNNCKLTSNSASSAGGGAYSGTLNNCTLTGNLASSYGGGASFGTLNNCIVYYNSAPTGANYYLGALDHCCASPMADSGTDNFAFDPMFVDLLDGDLHLRNASPCINAGRNAYTSEETDLDERPRIVSGTVDVGAYEVQAADNLLFKVWLQQHGLSSDGSANFADADGDGLNNWQEFVTGTNPTNNLSTFRFVLAVKSGSGFTVTWLSETNRNYFLQRTTDFTAQSLFQTVATNIPGEPVTTSYTDTNVTGLISFFYRAGIVGNGQPSGGSIISYAWLQQNGLPYDGTIDFADPDHDGMNNWQEWKAGTGPSNAASALWMLSPVFGVSGASVSWTSVTNRFYSLERATNPGPAQSFSLLRSNIVGLPGTTIYLDTNTAGLSPFFYRVRVQD